MIHLALVVASFLFLAWVALVVLGIALRVFFAILEAIFDR